MGGYFQVKIKLYQGNHDIIKAVMWFKYPIKIIVSVEEDLITVITNYLLRKGRKK